MSPSVKMILTIKTVKQLKALARTRGLKYYSKLKKDDLILLIESSYRTPTVEEVERSTPTVELEYDLIEYLPDSITCVVTRELDDGIYSIENVQKKLYICPTKYKDKYTYLYL